MNRIFWQSKALKQMRKIPAHLGKAIRVAVDEELVDLSTARNVKTLINHVYGYRLRVGNYRVFEWDGAIRIITIEEVKNAMNKPISFQTIRGSDGRPAFVVVPYDEFVKNYTQANDLVPNEVVKLVFDDNMTPAKAWRVHLEVTQAEMALRMGITQSAYAQLERSEKPRKTSREKMATALGIRLGQLDF